MASLSEVREMAFQRANMEYAAGVQDEDRQITNAEADREINKGYKELYGYLIRHGMHRAEEVYEITTDGSRTYDLPSDLLAVLTVHRVDGDDNAYRLPRHDLRVRVSSAFGSGVAQSYRVVGATIEFNPLTSGETIEVRYVPVPGDMVADADQLDGVLGWEEYVVLYAAVKFLQKEGSHKTAMALQNDMRELLERIKVEARASEFTEGQVVQRTRTGTTDPLLPGSYTTGGRPPWWWMF